MKRSVTASNRPHRRTHHILPPLLVETSRPISILVLVPRLSPFLTPKGYLHLTVAGFKHFPAMSTSILPTLSPSLEQRGSNLDHHTSSQYTPIPCDSTFLAARYLPLVIHAYMSPNFATYLCPCTMNAHQCCCI